MGQKALKQNSICLPNVNSRGEPYKDPETDSWVKYLTAKEFFNDFVEVKEKIHTGTASGSEYTWVSIDVTESELDSNGKLTVYIDAKEEGFSGIFGSHVPVGVLEDGELVVKNLGGFTVDASNVTGDIDGGTY